MDKKHMKFETYCFNGFEARPGRDEFGAKGRCLDSVLVFTVPEDWRLVTEDDVTCLGSSRQEVTGVVGVYEGRDLDRFPKGFRHVRR